MRILLVGGGTGGHVYPLIAVADELKQQSQQQGLGLEIMLLGEGRFFERAAKEKGYPFKRIWSGKLRRYTSPLTFIDVFKLPIGFIQSLWHIFWFMPDVVFTKGGSASFAPAIVSKLYFIPIFIHESDTVPGLANTMIARLAGKVFVAFESAAKYFGSKAEYVGNPVRKDLLNGDRSKAIEAFNLNNDRKTILVLGGSLGAKMINDTVLNALVILVDKFQLIHQCGESQYKLVKSASDKLIQEGEGRDYDVKIKENYRLYPFFDTQELSLAYAMADVIISRAGAGLIFEIASLGKPVILIPLVKGSRGEQTTNAIELSKFGAVIIEEQNLTRNIILDQVKHLLENSASVSENIKSFIKTDSAALIATSILSNA